MVSVWLFLTHSCSSSVPHDVRIDSKLRSHTWPQKQTQGVRMFHVSDMLHGEGPGPLWRVLPWAPGGRGAISHGRKIEAERRGPWRRRTSPQPPPLGICVRLRKNSSDIWQEVLIAVLVEKRISLLYSSDGEEGTFSLESLTRLTSSVNRHNRGQFHQVSFNLCKGGSAEFCDWLSFFLTSGCNQSRLRYKTNHNLTASPALFANCMFFVFLRWFLTG